MIGTLLYYARTVDSTMLVALGTISAAQSTGTEATVAAVTQLLNYCATHPNAMIHFRSSAMILHSHNDALHLS
jgi:ABC-type methionine transport system permease subunit